MAQPAVSANPVTTIGGEDGRPAIVVEDNAPKNAQGDAGSDTTTLLGNQAQPIHDVFAPDPAKDIKSETTQMPAEPEREFDKVVVPVSAAVEPDNAGVDPVIDNAVHAGPMGHDEQEAELARQDLFEEGS